MDDSVRWEVGDDSSADFDEQIPFGSLVGQVIDWDNLRADEVERAWQDLDRWVNRIRRNYGLSPSVVPPLWHHHPELVWELSALHTHWLASYDPSAPPSAPLLWHRDFAEARVRLREWVAACGTKLDRDRATRQTAWPGEAPIDAGSEIAITDRDEDFRQFVVADVARRAADEQTSGREQR